MKTDILIEDEAGNVILTITLYGKTEEELNLAVEALEKVYLFCNVYPCTYK